MGSGAKELSAWMLVVGESAGRWEDEGCGISEVFLSPLASEVPGDMLAGAVH